MRCSVTASGWHMVACLGQGGTREIGVLILLRTLLCDFRHSGLTSHVMITATNSQ